MLSEREVSASIGSTAYDTAGDKIGTVEHFFVDDRTGAPSWVVVTTGLFGTRRSIVPAADATYADGGLRVPVTADAVKNAPHPTGDHLSPDEEDTLRRHYGLGAADAPGERPVPDPTTTERDGARDTGRHAAPPATDEAVPVPVPVPETGTGTGTPPRTDGSMTRSEEQLRLDTERVATTRARLVKYVVTEEVRITVPVRREEIRVEQVPIDATDEPGESLLEAGAPQQSTGAAGGHLPSEIILHTERPVVTVEVVPTERVRLRTELVQGQETVTGQVQREQIVVDEDAPRRA
jgi:stress response protein YsnF